MKANNFKGISVAGSFYLTRRKTNMRKVNLDAYYFCIGENYLRTIPIGICGETHKLIDYMMMCFPGYGERYIRKGFENYSEKYVLDYIYNSIGKRLQRVNKKEQMTLELLSNI